MFLDRLAFCLAITAALYLGGVGRADLPCTYDYANPKAACANAVDTQAPDKACQITGGEKADCDKLATNTYYVNYSAPDTGDARDKGWVGWVCKGAGDVPYYCELVTAKDGTIPTKLCGSAFKCKWDKSKLTCGPVAEETLDKHSKYYRTLQCEEEDPGTGTSSGRRKSGGR